MSYVFMLLLRMRWLSVTFFGGQRVRAEMLRMYRFGCWFWSGECLGQYEGVMGQDYMWVRVEVEKYWMFNIAMAVPIQPFCSLVLLEVVLMVIKYVSRCI